MNSEKSDRLARSWANEHGAPALTNSVSADADLETNTR
jgi:hypothetical protein